MKRNEENSNIKGKVLSNQIATRNTKEKKLGGWACTETGCERSCYDFPCVFRGYHARVKGPKIIITRKPKVLNLHLNLRLQKLPYCCTKRTPWLMSSECNVNVECIFIDQTSLLLSIFAFQRQVSNIFFSHDYTVLVLQINGMRLTKTSEDVYRMYNE